MTGDQCRDRVGELGPRGRVGDLGPVVVDPPAHDRPPVVAAALGPVQLVAAERPHLDDVEVARRGVDGRALDVPVAVGPDLGPGVRVPHERVVVGHRAVAVEADDGPEVVREVLGRVELEPLAHGQEHVALGRERDAAAEVLRPGDVGLLREQDLEAGQAIALQAPPPERRCRAPLRPGAGVGEVDVAGLVEVRVERYVEEAALPLRVHGRRARDLVRELAVGAHDAEPPRPLGHEEPSVGEERHAPRALEVAVDDGLHGDGAGLGDDLVGRAAAVPVRRLSGGRGGQEQEGDEGGAERHGSGGR